MKRLYIILAVAAIAITSCTKEQMNAEMENTGLESRVCKAELAATLPAETKLTLDGLDLKWNAGDRMKVRCANLSVWKDTIDCDVVTASSDGSTSKFTGTIRYGRSGGKMSKIYVFYSKDGGYYSKSAATFVQNVSSEQSGRLDDLMDNALLYSKVDTLNITESGDTCRMSTTMRPFFSVIKMNVASGLGVKNIRMYAPGAAGRYVINTSKTYGTTGKSTFLETTGPVDYVDVSRGGETISGDVYILVTPTVYDSGTGEYRLDTDSLQFVFTNASGAEAEVTGTLNRKVMCGSLKNLGNVTSLIFKKPAIDGGYLTLLKDNTLKISVADTVSGCTFYYEQGESTCAEPTTSSNRFSAADGFIPGDSTQYFARFVKVLVHTDNPDYSDLVLSGYVRNWEITSGCSLLTAYNNYLTTSGKTSLTTADDGQVAADGLVLYMYNDKGGTLVPKTGWTENNTGRVFITSTSLYAGDCVFRHRSYTARNTDQDKTIHLYKNKVEVASDTLAYKVLQTSVHRFTDCAAGTEFRFRSGATFSYSAISILETGDLTKSFAGLRIQGFSGNTPYSL